VFDVGGLPFPTENKGGSIADYGAVQLYVQNARRVNPNFVLADHAVDVGRICALVNGMPLALELAASWSRVLTSAEIAAEIERGLDILETTARNAPERHRSMRAVMDYSWIGGRSLRYP
jgi:predicted ATPase